MPQGAYIPSLSELTPQGTASNGSVQPGTNYGTNSGLDALRQAATQEASYRWQKHQQIQQSKENVFKNLGDLESVPVMPEDRDQLTAETKEAFKMLLDPSIFNGGNEAGRAAYETKFADLARKTYQSKQDLINYQIDKKVAAEHPEYQNPPNAEYLANYPKMGLGNRTYDGMIPTPTLDYQKLIIKPAQLGAVKDVPDTFELGDYATNPTTNKQEFKLNDKGRWTRESSKMQEVDANAIAQNTDYLRQQNWGLLKPDFDYKFKYVFTPEARKQFSIDGDGKTPDYDKMFQPLTDLAISTAKTQSPVINFRENPIEKEANAEAHKDARARLHAASQTEAPVTFKVYDNIVNSLDPKSGGNFIKLQDKILGKPLNELPEEQANAVLERARTKNKNYNYDDIFITNDNGEVWIIDKDKANFPSADNPLSADQLKNYKIPRSAYVTKMTKVSTDIGANQPLGVKSKTEIVKEGQKPPIKKTADPLGILDDGE